MIRRTTDCKGHIGVSREHPPFMASLGVGEHIEVNLRCRKDVSEQ